MLAADQHGRRPPYRSIMRELSKTVTRLVWVENIWTIGLKVIGSIPCSVLNFLEPPKSEYSPLKHGGKYSIIPCPSSSHILVSRLLFFFYTDILSVVLMPVRRYRLSCYDTLILLIFTTSSTTPHLFHMISPMLSEINSLICSSVNTSVWMTGLNCARVWRVILSRNVLYAGKG